MKILADHKSRYAASLLAHGFCTNVETSFKEAENVMYGNMLTFTEDFYLLYDPSWQSPYIVKKVWNLKGDTKVRYKTDCNFKRFRW